MYLSFESKILEENQVTDYLIRVVQPRLSAVDGVQRADILGGRTFALRAWLKPDRMAALNVSPSQVRQALAANNYLSAIGQTKGTFLQLNLSATTDIESVEDFRRLVIRQDGGTLVRLGDVADVVLGAETYEQDVRMSGQRAVFMGVWVLPNANALDVIARVRAELDKIKAELPTGLTGAIAFDATKYIDNAIQRGAQDADRDHLHRHHGHLPVPGVAARGDGAGGGHPGVADRRHLPDAGAGVLAEPAHAAGHRAVGGSGGRRRHRGGRERRPPHPRGEEPDARRPCSGPASWWARSSP